MWRAHVSFAFTHAGHLACSLFFVILKNTSEMGWGGSCVLHGYFIKVYIHIQDDRIERHFFVFNLRPPKHVFPTVAALTNLLVLKQLPVSLKQPDSKTGRAAGPSPTQPHVLSHREQVVGAAHALRPPLKTVGVSLASASGLVFPVDVCLLPGFQKASLSSLGMSPSVCSFMHAHMHSLVFV